MKKSIDIEEFVDDYCMGVKDKDMLEKFGMTPNQMIALVKKLISQGMISKDEYFQRSERIKQYELRQERDFLKSLYHCPVCGHVQPTPFELCPACGINIQEFDAAQKPTDEWIVEQLDVPETDTQSIEIPPPPESEIVENPSLGSPARSEGAQPSKPAPAPPVEEVEEPHPAVASVSRGAPEQEFSRELQAMVGMVLEEPEVLSPEELGYSLEDYGITGILADSPRAATLRAEDASDTGPALAVKILHDAAVGDSEYNEVIDRIVHYQANMNDNNILKLVGTGFIEEKKVLVYEYMPLDLETILRNNPEGLPFELVQKYMSQILNGFGYAHTHKARDGSGHRVPHFSLKTTKILFDENGEVAKIDDFGMTKALIEVRGHRKYLWEEPGCDLAALAPEAFIYGSKSVNGIGIDIYALGVLFYRMVVGKPPFECDSMEDYKFAHVKRYPAPLRVLNHMVPRWLDDMIMKCLEKEPAERWRSATQMELSVGKTITPA